MRRDGLGIGVFFLVAGALFLLDAIGALDLRAEFLLPLLLIGFGIALIASGRRPAPAVDRRPPERIEEPPTEDLREGEQQIPPEPPPPTPPPPREDEEP